MKASDPGRALELLADDAVELAADIDAHEKSTASAELLGAVARFAEVARRHRQQHPRAASPAHEKRRR